MDLKVLIVDDDDIFLMIHTTLIRKSKLGDPITFRNAKELIYYLIHNKDAETKYLVFLDINMPEMNAWEFLERTHVCSNSYYVVIVTSSINQADKEKAKKYPSIIDFIEKPVRREYFDEIKSLSALSPFFRS